MKSYFFLLYLGLLLWHTSSSQVNLQKGALELAIGINSFQDNVSKLNNNVSLLYSSGNGLRVDEVSGPVGAGWSIKGISFITRIQKGLPDDQVEYSGSWNDINKYGSGSLYNTTPISDGCPKALLTYPIFETQGEHYTYDNLTQSDREIDQFMFYIEGRTGTFVINRLGQAICLNDSRVKISITHASIPDCRTTISKFTIINELGVVYEFAELEKTKVYNYQPADLGQTSAFSGSIFLQCDLSSPTEVPMAYKPYVINNWYVSKIKDKQVNREISFIYFQQTYDIAAANTSISYSGPIPPQKYTTAQSPDHSLSMTTYRSTVIHPEISSIQYPDGNKIDFKYDEPRKDVPSVNSLSEIRLFKDNTLLQKFQLTQSYFVKNEIKLPAIPEERWSRLCLLSIKKVASDNVTSENPYIFDYYKGSNNTEDFIPPYYFHAKDAWGYYNGDKCGVSTADFLQYGNIGQVESFVKLALFNDVESTSPLTDYCDFKSTCKTKYASNGLLKSVVNPYGGKTEYEYEQNGKNPVIPVPCDVDQVIVGGVHLSKIISKQIDGQNDMIEEYSYVTENNQSSLWGVENPKNRMYTPSYFEPQSKYFVPGSGCSYRYQYPGTLHALHFSRAAVGGTDPLWSFKNQAYSELNSSTDAMYSNGDEQAGNLLVAAVVKILVGFIIDIIDCSRDYSVNNYPIVHVNSAVNFQNSLPSQFKRVVVKKYSASGITTGKTVHEFTSDEDFPLLIPSSVYSYPYTSKQRYLAWLYGNPKSVSYFDNQNNLVKSTNYSYTPISNTATDEKTRSCNCQVLYSRSYRSDLWGSSANIQDFTATTIPNELNVEFSNITTGRVELTGVVEKLFNKQGDFVTNTATYQYNTTNYMLSKQTSIDSKNRVTETRNYYIEDYDLSNPSNAVMNLMKNENIINVPVSSETWRTKPGGQPEMLAAKVSEYGVIANGDFKLIKTYGLESTTPVPNSIIGNFNPSQLVRDVSLIKLSSQINYSATGEAVEAKDVPGNRIATTIYSTAFSDRIPVATVSNASRNEVSFSSFEPEYNVDGLQMINVQNLIEPSVTGQGCARITAGSSIQAYFNGTKDYRLTLWATSSNIQLKVQQQTTFPNPIIVSKAISAPTINGWTYYEYIIPAGSGTTAIITGDCKIDEFRLYPQEASIVSSTYKAGVGKTSDCDINNRITYYEYDALNRIVKILDEKRNIVKTYEYHFKN